MHLDQSGWDRMATGEKDIELRLYDEKRQVIWLGDTIYFENSQDSSRILVTEVIGLLHYPSFKDLLQDISLDHFHSAQTIEEMIQRLRKYYSEQQETKNGVLGIKIKVVSAKHM